MIVGASGRGPQAFQSDFFTLMASYSAFVEGDTFSPRSQITFGSLDFLIEEIDELHLVSHNVVNTIGLGPRRSIRTKAEK